MKPLSNQSLQRLEYILNGIWDGTLKHTQRDVFCGSAKCVCGWYAHMHHPDIKKGGRYDYGVIMDDAWDFSQDDLGLTDTEAELLFSTNATKALHELVLSALQIGRRLHSEGLDWFYILTCYSHRYDYNGTSNIHFAISGEDKDAFVVALAEFLGVKIEYCFPRESYYLTPPVPSTTP